MTNEMSDMNRIFQASLAEARAIGIDELERQMKIIREDRAKMTALGNRLARYRRNRLAAEAEFLRAG